MADSVASLTDEELENCSGGEIVTTKEAKHQVGDIVAIKLHHMGVYCGVVRGEVLEVLFDEYGTNDDGLMTYRVRYRVIDEDNRIHIVKLEGLLA